MAERAVRSAARRRERWLRSMWRHEQLSVRMAVATATHHSWKSHAVVGTQTAGPAPVTKDVAPAPAVAPFSTPAVTYEAPAPVFDYVAPAHSVTFAVPAPVIDYVAPAHSVTYAVPAPVIDFVAPAHSVTHSAPAPVFEYVAPAPLFEFIAPASAGSFVVPSQQLRPAYTAAAVSTGVNLDAEFVGSASQVVGSLLHGEVFAEPVFNQVHQEQLAGGEIPENLVEIPVVQKQVIVGVRPERLVDASGPQKCERAACPRLPGAPLLGAPSMASPSAEAIDESTLSFLLAESLARVKEKEEVEELVADLARREPELLEELVRHRASFKRGDRGSRVEVAAAWWFKAKTALAKRETTASPGRYTNTGPAAPQQLDPGGASDTGHRQAP